MVAHIMGSIASPAMVFTDILSDTYLLFRFISLKFVIFWYHFFIID